MRELSKRKQKKLRNKQLRYTRATKSFFKRKRLCCEINIYGKYNGRRICRKCYWALIKIAEKCKKSILISS